MLALASVWIGLASLILAATMVLYRPAMTDNTIPIVLWAGSPGAICLAGLVLWASRKIDHPDPGLVSQRLQAKVAITMAIIAAALVYLLIIFSQKRDGGFEEFETRAAAAYNSPAAKGGELAPPDLVSPCTSPSTESRPLWPRGSRFGRCSTTSSWPRFGSPWKSTKTSSPGGPSIARSFARGTPSKSSHS